MRQFLMDNNTVVIATAFEDFTMAIDSETGDDIIPMSKETLESDFDCRMIIYDRIPNVTIIKEL